MLKALAEIPDEADRQVVQLYFFQELTLRQIGEQRGLSYDQARERLKRGKEYLLHALKDVDDPVR